MRKSGFLIASLPLLLSACGSDSDTARRVTVSELREALDAGEAFVVDVRSEDSFNQGHIQGAVSMPLAEIDERWTELPRDKRIVTYCS